MLTRLHKHYQSEGLSLPQRRAGGRTNNTFAMTEPDVANVVRFIKTFAEEHAVRLPGRVPGYRREDILLLPSSCTKSHVFRQYTDTAKCIGM
jgi:hypothetical protein